MAQYRGVEVADDLAGLIRHMDGVDDIHEELRDLQALWDNLSMLGEMSGTGVEIDAVRGDFARLTARLLGQLAGEARSKAALRLVGQAQVAINILVRNLFERTADIGFLATDADLCRYAEASAAEREALRPAVCERLREYQRKYSVYEDVILIAPGGEVLARLASDGPAATRDPLVARAVASAAPYLESYAPFDLQPAEPASLLYACRMLAADGRRAVGVLVLAFRFDDECRRVFGGLRADDDWTVLAWLDADGRVLASSDALQVPPGAQIPVVPGGGDSGARLLRFAGRLWLARTCAAQPYQGYAGPGWFGQAMVPIEHAFAPSDAASADGVLAQPVLEALSRSPLFSDAVREIPRAAEAIESTLRRAVWNGNVALGAAPPGRDSAFSKTLLREIGRTGTRTRGVFSRAVADLRHTVVSATLGDARARTALALDILDRNLYERVNDCRWWALATPFRSALEAADDSRDTADALTAILQGIHRLYTVYANLLLFDRSGRVVAVSQPDEAAHPGRLLDAPWVRKALALGDAQAHAVSAFEASPFYGGRPTLVYAAAVRGLADPRRVVGGIALVFDTEPQLRAMLDDTLPRDERGRGADGAFNLFVDGAGQVLAASTGAPDFGPSLPPALRAGSGEARIVHWQGTLVALAAAASTGYREYRNDGVRAISVVPLAGAAAPTDAAPRTPPHPAAPRPTGDSRRLDVASFLVAGQWYALPGSAVLEAIDASTILPLPGRALYVRGSVLHGGRSLLVLDLARLLGAADRAASDDAPQHIVLIRPTADFNGFGLLVDDLGDNPEIDPASLQTLTGGPMADSLVAQVVRGNGAPQDDMLKLLALPRLAAAAFGVRRAVTRAELTREQPQSIRA